MIPHQFSQPISNLGFEEEIDTTNNYPDGFVTKDQLEIERKINLQIIRDNGEKI